jgi:hypothetical protein
VEFIQILLPLVSLAVMIGLSIGFVFWVKKVFARRTAFWMSAADSLGLSFRKGKWGMHSLEGEHSGYSIHVGLEIEGVQDSRRGYTVYRLKCPETLQQRAEDGGLDGMVAQVEKARPRSILDPALETAAEVIFSDGEFNLCRNGYPRNAAEIVSNVQQLVDSVSRLEDW